MSRKYRVPASPSSSYFGTEFPLLFLCNDWQTVNISPLRGRQANDKCKMVKEMK